ncbi:MAG TPA: MgtC/SapB family protein [Longimicrobiales bacterium]|nr:MgtC/SapB family protein [Longimicrobiales bacterium]
MDTSTTGALIAELGLLRIDLLGRLLLAAVLGGAVGIERELSGKPAGFRTNLLICVGAALLTELSVTISLFSGGPADPGRIAAQIVSGIGFLGAGTIIQARGHVLGLTTAATLWVVAAIGMAVGARAYVEAVGTTILVVAVLLFLGRIESLLVRRTGRHTLRLTLGADGYDPGRVESGLRELGLDVGDFEIEWADDVLHIVVEASGSEADWRRVMERLSRWPGIRRMSRS